MFDHIDKSNLERFVCTSVKVEKLHLIIGAACMAVTLCYVPDPDFV